jgi:hypothetical protein
MRHRTCENIKPVEVAAKGVVHSSMYEEFATDKNKNETIKVEFSGLLESSVIISHTLDTPDQSSIISYGFRGKCMVCSICSSIFCCKY